MSQTVANAGYYLIGKRKNRLRNRRRKETTKMKYDYKKEFTAVESALLVLGEAEDYTDRFIKKYKNFLRGTVSNEELPIYIRNIAKEKLGEKSIAYSRVLKRLIDLYGEEAFKEDEEMSKVAAEKAEEEEKRRKAAIERAKAEREEFEKEKAELKKKREEKEQASWKALADTGGFIITPEGIRITIEPGEYPADTIKRYSPSIAQNYDYALDFLKDIKQQREIKDEDFDELNDLLLRRGWLQAFAGEINTRRFDDNALDNLHKYILELDWPDSLKVKLASSTSTVEVPLHDLLGISNEHELDSWIRGPLIKKKGRERRVREPREEESITEALNLLEAPPPKKPIGKVTPVKAIKAGTKIPPKKVAKKEPPKEEEEPEEPESKKWKSLKTYGIAKRIPKIKSIPGRSFNQILAGSEMGRRSRAHTVRTKPPITTKDEDGNDILIYNFKSSPSTTGLRQRGYARFFIPKKPTKKKLGDLPVELSCSCPDFKYRWEVANNKVGSAQIFHSNGKKPNQTNPTMRPGLCKHLIALGNYIRGVELAPAFNPYA
jgi:hypothetical protein